MDKVGSRNNRSFMDILTSIFKNVWVRRGVAVACLGYTGLLMWLAWLMPTSLNMRIRLPCLCCMCSSMLPHSG